MNVDFELEPEPPPVCETVRVVPFRSPVTGLGLGLKLEALKASESSDPLKR